MNTFSSSSSSVANAGSTGLRDYMVYDYQSMALALGITGIVAFVLYQAVLASPELGRFFRGHRREIAWHRHARCGPRRSRPKAASIRGRRSRGGGG